MTRKQQKILDNQIQYLCKHEQDRIKIIRQALNFQPNNSFLDEVETIERMFLKCLESRKQFKASHYFAGTAGWTVEYFPNKLKYKKNEDFKLRIFFSFVDADNFD